MMPARQLIRHCSSCGEECGQSCGYWLRSAAEDRRSEVGFDIRVNPQYAPVRSTTDYVAVKDGLGNVIGWKLNNPALEGLTGSSSSSLGG